MSEKAKVALAAVLMRIQRDPRVAYYFDPVTGCREKLVDAHCELNGVDVAAFRAKFDPTVKYEAPPKEAVGAELATHAMQEVPFAVQRIFEAFYAGNEIEAMRLTKQYVQTATGRVLPV